MVASCCNYLLKETHINNDETVYFQQKLFFCSGLKIFTNVASIILNHGSTDSCGGDRNSPTQAEFHAVMREICLKDRLLATVLSATAI